jgi:hypothetical protein
MDRQVALRTMYRRPRATCRRGHVKEPCGRCKECDRLTYERRAAARKTEGLTAPGRPLYSLRTLSFPKIISAHSDGAIRTGLVW